MTPAETSTAPNWSFRADEAARSVTRLFGQRLLFLPGTHIAAIVRPSGRVKNLARPWHYWWQAHYVDCLVDTGRRELGTEGRPGTRFDGENRPSAGQLASQLVAGIRLRNFLTFVNSYYDDMAWLALSTLRLEKLAEDSRKAAKAQALLDWLDARLFDPEQGMYLDGLRIAPGGDVVLESSIYTYNQGPVLGALLELGGEANLARASALVAAVARNLTLPAPLMGRSATVLRCEGTGDGGLFTGILVRYLALAAIDERLPAETRNTAATLVNDTAEAFWEGRRIVAAQEPLARKGGRILFSTRPELPARRSYPAGTAVELSTQLQAWMVLEAAASITGRSGLPEAAEAAEAAAAPDGPGDSAAGPAPQTTPDAMAGPAPESATESPAGN